MPAGLAGDQRAEVKSDNRNGSKRKIQIINQNRRYNSICISHSRYYYYYYYYCSSSIIVVVVVVDVVVVVAFTLIRPLQLVCYC